MAATPTSGSFGSTGPAHQRWCLAGTGVGSPGTTPAVGHGGGSLRTVRIVGVDCLDQAISRPRRDIVGKRPSRERAGAPPHGTGDQPPAEDGPYDTRGSQPNPQCTFVDPLTCDLDRSWLFRTRCGNQQPQSDGGYGRGVFGTNHSRLTTTWYQGVGRRRHDNGQSQHHHGASTSSPLRAPSLGRPHVALNAVS